MSLEMMVRVMKEAEVSRPQQSVLLAMAENADDEGKSCRPSVDRIAWKSGYKPRAVENIMRQLRDKKIIVLVAEARQHRAPEYEIHLENAAKKMPFEEWRALYGKHARGAKNAPLEEEPEDAPGVQSHDPGVQNGGSGVHFDDSRGALVSAPEPFEPSDEPSDEPGGAGKEEKKVRKDRSKPTPPEYRTKVETFLANHEDLADELREFIARVAAKNESGEMTYSRQWRAFCLPVDLALQDGSDRGAVLYALQEANRKKARDMHYFETVLENNPEGRPRRVQRPSSTRTEAVPPGEISGENGAARRKEGYEWLFGNDDSDADGERPRTRQERREAEERKREEAEAERRRRLKLTETEMRKWRSGMDDQTYQLQVMRLKRAAEKNGLDVEDVERLDEEVRAEYAQRKAG